MEEDDSKRKTSDVAAANLPDDLVVEILSHLPAKSLHRFKCISRSWRDMISDPYHRKKLPQTLAGVFHTSSNLNHRLAPATVTRRRHFTNVDSGVHDPPLVRPELGFLPSDAGEVVALDCCNGLLLCRYGGWIEDGLCIFPPQTFHYVVCNPATEKWVDLPVSSGHLGRYRTSRLAFDPAVSSHFHVFEFELVDADGGEAHAAAGFYSSRTGRWSHDTVRGLSRGTKGALRHAANRNLLVHAGTVSRTVLLHGALHLLGPEKAIAVVDVETKGWRSIQLPPRGGGGDVDLGFLGKSQGRLFYMNTVDVDGRLAFWALEDYDSGAWSLRLTLSSSRVFGSLNMDLRRLCMYSVVAVHPDRNVIFFVSAASRLLMSHDMDRSKGGYICVLGLGHHYQFMPYVPFFSESIADDHERVLRARAGRSEQGLHTYIC